MMRFMSLRGRLAELRGAQAALVGITSGVLANSDNTINIYKSNLLFNN